MEELFIMTPPPCSSITGISYFMDNQTPLKLVSTTSSKTSSVVRISRAIMPPTPALLKAISNRPYPFTVWFTMFSTCEAIRTSVWTNIASPPAFFIISTVSIPSFSLRLATTTLAPLSPNLIAVARPMPELPPVTSATLPANVFIFSLLFD